MRSKREKLAGCQVDEDGGWMSMQYFFSEKL